MGSGDSFFHMDIGCATPARHQVRSPLFTVHRVRHSHSPQVTVTGHGSPVRSQSPAVLQWPSTAAPLTGTASRPAPRRPLRALAAVAAAAAAAAAAVQAQLTSPAADKEPASAVSVAWTYRRPRRGEAPRLRGTGETPVAGGGVQGLRPPLRPPMTPAVAAALCRSQSPLGPYRAAAAAAVSSRAASVLAAAAAAAADPG